MFLFDYPANFYCTELILEFILYFIIVLVIRLLLFGADLYFLKKKKQLPNLFLENDHLRLKLYKNQKIKDKYRDDQELLSLLIQLETNNATALHEYVNTWSKVRISFFQSLVGAIPIYFIIRMEWDQFIITYIKQVIQALSTL
tara:strand:+ start:8779 stop:9207 length:429 start_codon:yes stop_codon:yes gene_type:complete